MSQKNRIFQHLQKLDQRDGGLTPSAVIKDAQRPDSPLHDRFEWDDKLAAQGHRLEQARDLIRSFRVTVQVGVTVIRPPQWIRDPARGSKEQGYRQITSFRSRSETAREAVMSEFGRARSALERAKNIAATLNIADDIDQLLADLDAATAKTAGKKERRKRA